MSFALIFAVAMAVHSQEQSVGYYSNGRLHDPAELPAEAPGLLKILRPRNRAWCTDDMRALLLETGSSLADTWPGLDRLQVGDVSARGGGKVSGHSSHQNGLDADIAYLRKDAREQDPQVIKGFDEWFVYKNEVTPNFDLERNWELMRRLVATGKVTRIFVDAVIKATLCNYAAGLEGGLEAHAETLRRLRPYPNHANHLHVRIRCPETSPRCTPQAEPPEGHGCNAIQTVDPGEFARN